MTHIIGLGYLTTFINCRDCFPCSEVTGWLYTVNCTEMRS